MKESATKSTNASWRRVGPALGYALSGLRQGYKEEPAFRQEVWCYGALMVVLAFFSPPLGLLLLCAGAVLLVFLVELLNSAVEACVDYATKDTRHPLAKKAKDTAAAAVLLANTMALGVFVYVFWMLWPR